VPELTSISRSAPLAWAEIPDLTFLIRRSQRGDGAAVEKLLDLAYPVLRQIASRLLRGGALQHRLAPQDLIHDAWLTRISKQGAVKNRGHYLASLTLAMKGQLIDHARSAKAMKRTPPAPATKGTGINTASLGPEELLNLEREVERLEKVDPRAAMVVRLRYYGGCSWEETACALGITIKMARGDWAFAARRLGERLGASLSS
jgi:RNA polymerase sigma factor (TIGR02999 family)